MNRRDLLRNGPLALLGIGATVIGVKAMPKLIEDTASHIATRSRALQGIIVMPPARPMSCEEIQERIDRSGISYAEYLKTRAMRD